MIVTYNWLKEYVDFKLPPDELRTRLTQMGPEVVSVQPIGIHNENKGKIILCQVKKIEQHQKLAHLKVVTVDQLKDGKLVTNSPHVAEGDFVVWAKPGAVLGGMTVGEKNFSGIVSTGMLIAKEQLGLEAKSSDIWVLGKDKKQAEEEFALYTEADYRIEVELTANRSDCLSVIGIAREIAAMLDLPLKLPTVGTENYPVLKEEPKVSLLEKKLCPRYTGRILRGVEVKPSPAWMARRLEVCGLRSINNVVDATNYVLLEYGHPTHAFDLDLLDGQKIVIRRAADGESITTLDGEKHTLNEDVLVIADEKKAVALAGIMGGENSEIRDTTTNVFLESAFFDPISIRKTAKRYGIRTESSYRFERTADYGVTVTVIQRLTQLIGMTCPDLQVSPIYDEYPQPMKEKMISLSTEFVEKYLGFEMKTDDVERYLSRLGFAIVRSWDDGCEVRVPSFRSDVSRPVDLVEEIARVYGYNNIPINYFKPPVDVEALQKPQRFEFVLRPMMRTLGYSEVFNFSFTNDQLLSRFGIKEGVIALRNPLSSDASLLRPYLVLQLVETLDRNIRKTYRESFLFFEIGKTFEKTGKSPEEWEHTHMAFLHYGAGSDVYDVTATVEKLVHMQGQKVIDILPAKLPFLHPINSAVFEVEGKLLGFAGEIHPDVKEAFEFRYPVFVAELDCGVLESLKKPVARLQEIPTLPSIPRDLSVVVDRSVPGRKLMNAIMLAHPLIRQVEFVDVYVGPQLPPNKKSVTFSFLVQAAEKTLTDEEANDIRDEVVALLKKRFDAELR